MTKNTVKRKQLTKEERMCIYNKCQGHCAYCGSKLTIKQMQVDHYIPFEFAEVMVKDGFDPNAMDNLLPSCRQCNYIKSSMMPEKFRGAITRWCGVLARTSVTYRNALRFGQITENKHYPRFYFELRGVKVTDALRDFNESYRTEREARDKLQEAKDAGYSWV